MEMDFKFDRPVRFVDLESSFSLVTEPALMREQYLEQINKFLERLRRGCHEFNADYRQVVDATQNYEKVLADFLGGTRAHARRRLHVSTMTFLQPFILWGLPLVLLPVMIHLINRMRHRPQPWAAMRFLVSATRSSVSHANCGNG